MTELDTSSGASGGATPEGTPAPAQAPPSDRTAARLAREKRERDRERKRAARAAAKGGPPAPAAAADGPPPVAAPVLPERTDEDRARDLAAFLAVVWRVLGIVAGLVGWQLDPYTEGERTRDAAAWVPVARNYPSVDSLVRWVSAPAALLDRVASKLHRRGAKPASATEARPA